MTDPLKSDLTALTEEIERPAVSDWLRPILCRIWTVGQGLYRKQRKLERDIAALEKAIQSPDVKRALRRGDPHDYVGEP